MGVRVRVRVRVGVRVRANPNPISNANPNPDQVTVAWGCLLPYDAARRHLATGHLQLPLQFGARRAPLSGAPLAAVLG